MRPTCAPAVRRDWGGNGPYATSVLAFTSTDSLTWNFASIIANASDFTSSEEGPNENDLTLLADGSTIMAIIRMDAGDGPETHPYKNYARSISTDGGKSWSTATPIPNVGCARPRLLMLGEANQGPLVLTGGRARNRNTSGASTASCKRLSRATLTWSSDLLLGCRADVLLWVNDDGMGTAWVEYSLSYWHNVLESNPELQFTAHVNSTSGHRQTTSYTSLLRTGPSSALVTYNMQRDGTPGYVFSMPFDFA